LLSRDDGQFCCGFAASSRLLKKSLVSPRES
jgi:hypothetical protein